MIYAVCALVLVIAASTCLLSLMFASRDREEAWDGLKEFERKESNKH